jgi:hypothetical protein
MRKERSNKERSDASRRESENLPIVRQLYARGMAEIEERRKVDPNYR